MKKGVMSRHQTTGWERIPPNDQGIVG